MQRDAAVHAFVAAYGLVALILTSGLGVSHKFAPMTYMRPLAALTPIALWLIFIVLALRSLRARQPLRAWRDSTLAVFNPQVAAGLLLFGSLSVFIGIFSSVKTMLTDVTPFFADTYLADLDRFLHLGRDPWRLTMLPPPLSNVIELLYAVAWGLALTGSMLAALLLPRLRSVRSQYLWTFLITWVLLGNVLACAGLSAGPTFYSQVTGSDRFAELTQYLEQHSILQRYAREFLWKTYISGEIVAGAGISAFPSMHVAAATLFALLAASVNRWWMWTGLVFLVSILFGSVHLGWHYAVDGYFSIAATVLVWLAVGRHLKTGS